MREKGKALGVVALVLAVLGISASAVLNKLAMAGGMHPIWLNVFRLGIAWIVTVPFFLKKGGNKQALLALTARERRLLALSGVMLAGHFTTWAYALFYADSLIAVSIWSTFSLMTVVGSAVILQEKTPLPALFGIMLAIVGVGICAIGASSSQLLGVGMALLAAITQAVYTLCGRVLRAKLDNIRYTTVVYGIALTCLLLCALALRIPLGPLTAQSIGGAVALAVVCTLGGHSMQNYALKYFKAPTVSAAILTEVFTGPILVYLILGEAPRRTSIIGGMIILAGVAWYMYYEWRKASGAVQGDGGKAQRSEL